MKISPVKLSGVLLGSALMFGAGVEFGSDQSAPSPMAHTMTSHVRATHSAPRYPGCTYNGSHMNDGDVDSTPVPGVNVRCDSGSVDTIGHARHLKSCPAPAYIGQNAGYIASGSRIIGVNGGNALAGGDVYFCYDGHVYVS